MTRRELLVASAAPAALALTKTLPLPIVDPPAPECRARFCRHFKPDPALGDRRGRCGLGPCG